MLLGISVFLHVKHETTITATSFIYFYFFVAESSVEMMT